MTGSPTSLVTREMLDMIGRESTPATFEVDRTGIRMFARATGHGDPVFYDVAAARAAGYPDLPAPPGYFGTEVYAPWLEAGRDPIAEPRTASGLTRGLNGGSTIEYLAGIHAGDLLTVTWQVLGYEEKQSSLGPMLLTSRLATYRRGGEVVARLHHTLIEY